MRSTLALVLVAAGVACGGAAPVETAPTSPGAAPAPGRTASPAVAPSPVAFLPEPDARIPGDPEAVATLLETVTGELRRSIERWRSESDPSRGKPPRDVVHQALLQQRIYRTLARDAELAAATIPRLPKSLRGEAKANTNAAAKLFSLVRPISEPSGFKTVPPQPADVLRGYFEEAEERFGVDWEVLAAVCYVESKFGRVVSDSYAGAQGPMQFIPSTWAAYGMGGDVHEMRDAVMGAANYLKANGAPHDYRNALYAYNHAWEYVDAILAHARQIMDDERDYYAYYNWQVFVLTTDGDQRLTGPGL